MKAVLLSVRPEWCEKILNRQKTLEIRKTRPKLETPFKIYIYCTKSVRRVSCGGSMCYYEDDLAILAEPWRPAKYGNPYGSLGDGEYLLNGQVIAEFICDFIYNDYGHCNGQEVLDSDLPGTAMTFEQYNSYCNGKVGYGWHISDLKIYDKPKELFDFYRPGAESLEELGDDERLCNYCEATNCGELKCYSTPNGYTSCEGDWCDDAYQEYLDQNFMLRRPPQSWCYVEELEVQK